jgi:carbon starvation protein
MLAALALMVATVYLAKNERPFKITIIPFIFMVIVETWALAYNIKTFAAASDWLLTIIGVILLVLEIWMVVESINVFGKIRRNEIETNALDI